MEGINKKEKPIVDPNQVEIDFPPHNDEMEKERKEIAIKFRVGDPKKLFKIEGRWYHIDGYIKKPVEEWDAEMRKLDEDLPYWQK